MQEIERFILENEINGTDVIYSGDFNICADYNRGTCVPNFLRLPNNFSPINLLNIPTYNSGQTLDLLFTKK